MAALQRVSAFLPDLSGLIPEPLKPYAKFVVVLALGLIYAAVSLTVLDDSTGKEWAGIVLFIASALGVISTTNESTEDEDPPPDDALVSDGGDAIDPSGDLGFEPDDEAGEVIAPAPVEELPPEAVPEQPPAETQPPAPPEDESIKGPGEQRRDPEPPPPDVSGR